MSLASVGLHKKQLVSIIFWVSQHLCVPLIGQSATKIDRRSGHVTTTMLQCITTRHHNGAFRLLNGTGLFALRPIFQTICCEGVLRREHLTSRSTPHNPSATAGQNKHNQSQQNRAHSSTICHHNPTTLLSGASPKRQSKNHVIKKKERETPTPSQTLLTVIRAESLFRTGLLASCLLRGVTTSAL